MTARTEIDPRLWAPKHRETLLGTVILFLILNLTLFPFLWGDKTLQDSVNVASLYSTGSRPKPVTNIQAYRVLDAGAPAWQTEPEFPLERHIIGGEHTVPLWNPYSGYGMPLAADMLSQPYSPFAWIPMIWSTARGYDFFIVVRLLAAGLFTFLFLRQFTGFWPALTGGASYMLTGYLWLFVTMPELSVEVLTPALLYGTERCLRRPDFRMAALFALFLALSILGGMPESTILALGLVYVYGLVRVLGDATLRGNAAKIAAFVSLGTVLGIGLSAIVVIPFLEYVPLSTNMHTSQPSTGLRSDAWSPAYIALYLAPLLHGPPWNNIFGGSYGGSGMPGSWSGIRGFFGSAAAFFAVVAATGQLADRMRRRRGDQAPTLFFAAVALALLLKRFGSWPVNWVGLLPGLNLVWFPKYEEGIIAVCASVLVGCGVARICDRRAPGFVVWVAAFVPLSILTIGAGSEKPAFLVLMQHRGFYLGSLIAALLFLGACGAVTILLSNRRLSPAAFGILVFALIVAEPLATYIVPLYYVVNAQAPQSASTLGGAPYVTFLKRNLGKGERFFGEDAILYPEWSAAFGIPDVRALDALYPARYLPFVRAFFPVGPDEELVNRFVGAVQTNFVTAMQHRFLALSSIRYIGVGTRPTRIPGPCASRDRSFTNHGAGSLDVILTGAGAAGIANGGELSTQGQYSIGGWAVDHTRDGPAKGVCLVVDGRLDPRAASAYGGARPDVVAAYHNDDRLLRSAYLIAIPPGLLSSGHHEIQVAAISADGSLAIIGERSIIVRETGHATGSPGIFETGLRAHAGVVADFRIAYTDAAVTLYRYRSPLPRVALYRRVRIASTGASALRLLTDPSFDPRSEAIAERDDTTLRILAAERRTPVVAGRLEAYTSNYVRASVDATTTSLAVLNDTGFPGWDVYVDGGKAQSVRANYLFRGVVVGPGKHSVEFRYEPRSFSVAATMSAVSLATIVAMIVVPFFRLRRRTSTGTG
jgi:hypothetical protein